MLSFLFVPLRRQVLVTRIQQAPSRRRRQVLGEFLPPNLHGPPCLSTRPYPIQEL